MNKNTKTKLDSKTERTRIAKLEAEVTDLKTELHTVRERTKHLFSALRLSPMALCHHDRSLRYTWLYNSHMGFNDQEIIGKTDWDILDKDLADRMGAIKQRVLDTGIAERHEIPTIIGDDNAEYFDLVVEPIRDNESQAIIGLACSGIDITEYRRTKDKLKPERLKQRFGLTKTEADIASKLAQGWGADKISMASHRSINTTRTHIKSIFRKTNSNSQTQLTTLLLTQ